MGYYVYGNSGVFLIKAEHNKEICDAARELNKRDDLKRGGASGGEKWFSWLNNVNWDALSTAKELLEELGFDVEVDEDGDIIEVSYDSKIGQEELFFGVIAPFISEGSEIYWKGDDDERWLWVFRNGKMFTKQGSLDIVYGDDEEFTMPTSAW